MDITEVRQIAALIVEVQHAVWQEDSTEAMLRHLHWLRDVLHRIARAAPDRSEKDLRFGLALAAKNARRLRRRIEDRLGVRN